MEKYDSIKKIVAGLFFLGGIALIFFVIFTLGRDKGLTQPKFQVTVYYRDVGGLADGAPVRLAGVNVGNVEDISFLEKEIQGRKVVVILNIFDKYRNQLNRDAHFAIKTAGVLGDKQIEINLIDDGKTLDLSRPIMGEESLDVQELAGVFAAAAESFTKTSEDLNKIDMEGLSKVVGETAESLLITAQGINKLLKELEYVTKKSKRLMDRIEQKVIDGNLFKVF